MRFYGCVASGEHVQGFSTVPEHTPDLSQGAVVVHHMLEDLVAHNNVEGTVIKWQRVGVPANEAESPAAREFVRMRPLAEAKITSVRVKAQTTEPMNHVAIAATEVENPRASGDMTTQALKHAHESKCAVRSAC